MLMMAFSKFSRVHRKVYSVYSVKSVFYTHVLHSFSCIHLHTLVRPYTHFRIQISFFIQEGKNSTSKHLHALFTTLSMLSMVSASHKTADDSF